MDNETSKVLNDILSTLKSLETRVSNIESGAVNISNSTIIQTKSDRKISIKEFLIDRAPSDAVQTTLAIGYYMEKYENMQFFNKADIEKGFRTAKEKPPVNINDKINMCIKNGHMMEAETKKDSLKAWSLTRTGENMVEIGFRNSTKNKPL